MDDGAAGLDTGVVATVTCTHTTLSLDVAVRGYSTGSNVLDLPGCR
jgi:hypothetical protein